MSKGVDLSTDSAALSAVIKVFFWPGRLPARHQSGMNWLALRQHLTALKGSQPHLRQLFIASLVHPRKAFQTPDRTGYLRRQCRRVARRSA